MCIIQTTIVVVRDDDNTLPIKDTAWEPRLGLAYYIPTSKTVLRASYNRVLFTPEFENVLLSSSAEAAALVPPVVQQSHELGGGELPVRSERQNAYDFGGQPGIG